MLVLSSGGPDSLIAYAWEKWTRGHQDVKVGRVEMNTLASVAEERAYRALFPSEDRVSMPKLYTSHCPLPIEDEDFVIPGRNLLLAAIALAVGHRDIVISIQKDEMSVPDRKLAFLWKAREALSYAIGEHVALRTPFENKDKTEMVEWFLGCSDIPWVESKRLDLLTQSMSCYKPTWTRPEDGFAHCGDCPACIRRYTAFKPFGVRTFWKMEPRESVLAAQYVRRAREGHYSEQRNQRILETLT